MTYDSIISEISDDAINVAISIKSAMPSEIISACLYRYKHELVTDDDILIKHNPLGVRDPKTRITNAYTCLYDGISVGATDGIILKSIPKDDMLLFIKTRNLRSFDLAYVKTAESDIIDLSIDQHIPFVDQYIVHKSDKTIALVTSSIEEVKQMLNINTSYITTNSRGKVMNFKPAVRKNSIATTVSITAGSKIVCTNVHLYAEYNSTAPIRNITGVYYIYESNNFGGRYHICKKSFIGNDELTVPVGYIKATDIVI